MSENNHAPGTPHTAMTYKQAGVDIDAGERLVEMIKPLAAATRRPGADAALGGFGGLFDLKAAGFSDPVLVSATDGVGTKLRLAIELGIHHTVGIDLVAMCVNDLVVQGAEPLFFLDYFATGKLAPEIAARVVEGIAEGCHRAGCALIGGETAEMPGMYAQGDYDLAGFSVGAVERPDILPKATIASGDMLIGLASSGIHSNGFSLVRHILSSHEIALTTPAPFAPAASLGEALLTPTCIYVASCLAAIKTGDVKALAHITGGGLTENLPRVLPDGISAEIDLAAWDLPPIFAWLRQLGHIADAELLKTFNCGIGMIAVSAPDRVEETLKSFEAAGERACVIGQLTNTKSAAQITYRGELQGG